MAESMVGIKRSHRCTEVTTANIGQDVTVMGWVQKSRNKGGIIFVDLRDRSGILQIIFEESDCGAENFAKAEKLRSEFVIAVTGRVEARSGAVNPNLATGAIEVRAKSMRVLSESETPPFPIEENSKTKEELRLKYRFLDLRRPDLQRNMMVRSRVATLTRAFLADEGFLEIETPTLIKSTPEGARDYLVPSRVHPGSFYALPQSPQLFKQLLMCSGYDRYFQIAAATGTRTCGRTASRNSPRSIWSCLSWMWTRCWTSMSVCCRSCLRRFVITICPCPCPG